jgi:hypothetical protein
MDANNGKDCGVTMGTQAAVRAKDDDTIRVQSLPGLVVTNADLLPGVMRVIATPPTANEEACEVMPVLTTPPTPNGEACEVMPVLSAEPTSNGDDCHLSPTHVSYPNSFHLKKIKIN